MRFRNIGATVMTTTEMDRIWLFFSFFFLFFSPQSSSLDQGSDCSGESRAIWNALEKADSAGGQH